LNKRSHLNLLPRICKQELHGQRRAGELSIPHNFVVVFVVIGLLIFCCCKCESFERLATTCACVKSFEFFVSTLSRNYHVILRHQIFWHLVEKNKRRH